MLMEGERFWKYQQSRDGVKDLNPLDVCMGKKMSKTSLRARISVLYTVQSAKGHRVLQSELRKSSVCVGSCCFLRLLLS